MITTEHSVNIAGEMLTIQEAADKYKMANVEQITSRLNAGWLGARSVLSPSVDTIEKINTEYYGLHMALEIFGASPKKVSDLNHVSKFLADFPQKIAMKRISQPHAFYYNDEEDKKRSGITGMVFLSTSHVSFHSYPYKNAGFATIDVYSCKSFDPWEVLRNSLNFFGGDATQITLTLRGKGFEN